MVAASGTTTTTVFGVGLVVPAIIVGLTREVRRFADKDYLAAYRRVRNAKCGRVLNAQSVGWPV